METTKIASAIMNLSISEQTKVYNRIAGEMTRAGHSVGYVKKFADRPTAYKRILVLAAAAHTKDVDLSGIFDGIQTPAPVETTPVETTPVETTPVETTPAPKEDSTPIAIDDSEISIPAPKTRKARTPKIAGEKKITKSELLRKAFEGSGLTGIHVDELMKASGFDAKNVAVGMGILRNPTRTKDPIKFAKVGKVYFRTEYAPR